MTISTVQAAGSIGVIYDQQAHELPDSALTQASNVRFRNGAVERVRGEAAIMGTPAAIPYGLFAYAAGTVRYAVHAGLTSVYVNDGSTSTDITGTAPTGNIDDKWTGGTLGGVLVLNNSVNAPMYWGGNTAVNLATLTAWPASTTCASMRPWKNYLFALDVTKSGTRYPHMVKWSSAADPGALPASWDETDAANDAGEVDLSETTDYIVDALPLGESLLVYKQSSTYAITYIGGQYIFSVRRLPVDCGMLARGCAAAIPQGHVVLTSGDVVLNNGFEVQSIVDGKVRDWLFSTIDANYYDRSFVVSNSTYNEVWVCFPSSGNTSCNKALIWNWKDGTFSVRDLTGVTCGVNGTIPSVADITIDGDSATIDSDGTSIEYIEGASTRAQCVLGTTTPALLLVDSGGDFSGVAFDALIERTGLAFGDQSRIKMVRSIYPRIEGPAGQTMYIQIGYTMDVEDDYTWGDSITYTIGTTRKADTFVSGRFLAWRIWSESSFSWRLKSIDIDYTMLGVY